MSEVEVKEHAVFVHPLYLKEKQKLYFDIRNEFMLEKLTYPRVFLYQKDNNVKGNTHWKLLKRFSKFPNDLESDSGELRVMSPTFQFYIDVCRTTNMFVIRDTMTKIEMHDPSRPDGPKQGEGVSADEQIQVGGGRSSENYQPGGD